MELKILPASYSEKQVKVAKPGFKKNAYLCASL
jgi:hypothetical protein